MRRHDPVPAAGASDRLGGFFLYLEGPADRGILDAWCQRLLPGAVSSLSRCSVILGGRQPARAAAHLRGVRREDVAARGLCVLDRDDGRDLPPAADGGSGLEFFTWGRRHIESYLLVPQAIRRGLRLPDSDTRVDRVLREHLPEADDEAAFLELDAKRVLGPSGPLARALGVRIPLTKVARATREQELHADVHAFFDRLRRELGPQAGRGHRGADGRLPSAPVQIG